MSDAAFTKLTDALQGLGEAYATFGKALVSFQKEIKHELKEDKRKVKGDKKSRPPSAYNIFIKEEGERMRSAGTSDSQTEIMKQLAVQWKGLNPSQKAAYDAKAKERTPATEVKVKQEPKAEMTPKKAKEISTPAEKVSKKHKKESHDETDHESAKKKKKHQHQQETVEYENEDYEHSQEKKKKKKKKHREEDD